MWPPLPARRARRFLELGVVQGYVKTILKRSFTSIKFFDVRKCLYIPGSIKLKYQPGFSLVLDIKFILYRNALESNMDISFDIVKWCAIVEAKWEIH